MFRDMLRFLTEEQYEDVILVAEMIPYIEMNVKPRGKLDRVVAQMYMSVKKLLRSFIVLQIVMLFITTQRFMAIENMSELVLAS